MQTRNPSTGMALNTLHRTDSLCVVCFLPGQLYRICSHVSFPKYVLKTDLALSPDKTHSTLPLTSLQPVSSDHGVLWQHLWDRVFSYLLVTVIHTESSHGVILLYSNIQDWLLGEGFGYQLAPAGAPQSIETTVRCRRQTSARFWLWRWPVGCDWSRWRSSVGLKSYFPHHVFSNALLNLILTKASFCLAVPAGLFFCKRSWFLLIHSALFCILEILVN